MAKYDRENCSLVGSELSDIIEKQEELMDRYFL